MAALVLGCAIGESAQAAEGADSWQAVPARLYEARDGERRLLDRLERFLEETHWQEAFDAGAQLLASDSGAVVAVGPELYISVQEYCHRLFSQLPGKPLEQYRQLVDEGAEVWYRRGIAQRDAPLLQQIVDHAFCSTWGDDALWALGEIALERGRYAEARRCWQRISPQIFSEPSGLCYPDSQMDLADLRARLLLVSVRARDWARAEEQLAELQLKHPAAVGKLGGRKVVYAEHLAALLERARGSSAVRANRDWPTFAGGSTRTSVAATADTHYDQHFALVRGASREVFPLVVDGLLVYQDESAVLAVELATGTQRFAIAQKVFEPASHRMRELPVPALAAAGDLVFGASGIPVGLRQGGQAEVAASALWGIDLDRDGAFMLQLTSEKAGVAFSSVMIGEPGQLLVALRGHDRVARAAVGCYDLDSQRWSWQRWLCRANTPATGSSHRVAAALLTTDGDMHRGPAVAADAGIVYWVTNLGAIAAVRADNGRILWIRTYPRVAAPLDAQGCCAYYRGPNPGIYHCGRLFALPTDGKELLALDGVTGAVQWRRGLVSEDALLCGAHDGKLLLADAGLQILDAGTGKVIGASDELPLEGRAIIVGERILWPSGGKIHGLSLETGRSAWEALPLPVSGAANLVASGDYLIVVQPSQITVYRSRF
ncbi:MAG: PQQ-binding-like beta-propeller repeat protein [Pirellulales bacterium]|nr:PQQ-binding-like beta-propeller repeat protein [Pirellulales bacterium]